MSHQTLNPYQSPSLGVDDSAPRAGRKGWVQHVPRVSRLMAYLGWLELAGGAVYLLIALGAVVLMSLSPDKFNEPYDSNGGRVTMGAAGVSIILSCLNVVICDGMAGGLHLVAARYNARFKGRALGVLALVVGVAVNFLTWAPFFAPLETPLCIYGLCVYFRRDVKEAFQQGDAGISAKEILAAHAGFIPPPLTATLVDEPA